MASTACFVIIVSKNDIPIYEAEVGSAPKKEDLSYHHQFILHAALDVVQDLAWTTNAIFMLLHDSRSEDGIKSFFQEVHELYIKIFLNPLYLPGSRITSSHFDTKVRALARKYL
ncbi:trafficking protein particle complex protein 2 isoform 2 [Zea mays]|uniref:SNARE-like superfamily protein n=1 Tax=Zea mays TaxID=4577 RepID=B6SIZ7_MAIZE|nr:trafficking protein particle complex protein 2 isoform 2 [Zea mays]ACG24830.1 trafficking protein particle complex protein 2 [Zea mays]ACN34926.1 unknown [Zea mays]ONM60970.1 SNARE-like superfamily protein [Zea mays]ONM60971.1 SNARE-like superfamily protein [Zea mays]